MTTPRKAGPGKGFTTPYPLDLVKTDCGESGKLRYKNSEDLNLNMMSPETPVMFPNMIKEMPLPK